jgi:hypothetical protein
MVMKEGRTSVCEKRSKKPLSIWLRLFRLRSAEFAKVFGAFFQKRTRFLLTIVRAMRHQ